MRLVAEVQKRKKFGTRTFVGINLKIKTQMGTNRYD